MTPRHLFLLVAAALLGANESPAQDDVTAIVRIVDADKKPMARPDWRLRASVLSFRPGGGIENLPGLTRRFSGSETKLTGLRKGQIWTLVLDAPGRGRVSRVLRIEDPKPILEVILPAPLPASSVKLRLVDARGRPLCGIPLGIRATTLSMERARKSRRTPPNPLLTQPDLHSGITDATGSFVVVVPSEQWGRIVIKWDTFPFNNRNEHPSRTLGITRFGRLEPGKQAEATVVVLGLERLASGRIVDADWVPREGVRVRLALEDAESALGQAMKELGRWEVTTDHEGRFAFWFPAALEKGELEVFAGEPDDPRTKIVRKAFVRGAEDLVVKLD